MSNAGRSTSGAWEWPALTGGADSAVILGFSACGPVDKARYRSLVFRRETQSDQRSRPRRTHHETHLSSFQNSPRASAWLSRPYEDPRGTCRHQCASGQRPQAPFGLTPVQSPDGWSSLSCGRDPCRGGPVAAVERLCSGACSTGSGRESILRPAWPGGSAADSCQGRYCREQLINKQRTAFNGSCE